MLIFVRTGPTIPFMRNLLIALSIACFLSACGLKGPLYLPNQKPAAQPPAANAPADEKKPSGTASP